jgi:nucleotide-binding universal stress UspA family protein
MPDRFLVCVDFSPLTEKTLERAIKVAVPGACALDLITVVPLPPSSARGNMAARQIFEQAQKSRRDAARAEVDKLMTKVPEALRGDAIVVDGIPADAITERAREGYDMVVLATHGRTGFSHALLGSVAERVVRYSPVPVLVVR